jgi:zinc transporter, ZIP family
MANSFTLRVKQFQTGAAGGSLRIGVALLVAVLLGLAGLSQARSFSQADAPGEVLTVHSITMPTTDSIIVELQNSGTDPVTVAQIQVDAAYWAFAIEPSAMIVPGKHATIKIPYLWVPEEPHIITVVTGSGAIVEGQIDAPSLSALP